jgi:thiamine phosphate synthase YjbQ (UPF0047 family)
MRSSTLRVDTARREVVDIKGDLMQLGTWQRVVLVDINRDNPHRTVRLSFAGA